MEITCHFRFRDFGHSHISIFHVHLQNIIPYKLCAFLLELCSRHGHSNSIPLWVCVCKCVYKYVNFLCSHKQTSKTLTIFKPMASKQKWPENQFQIGQTTEIFFSNSTIFGFFCINSHFPFFGTFRSWFVYFSGTTIFSTRKTVFLFGLLFYVFLFLCLVLWCIF